MQASADINQKGGRFGQSALHVAASIGHLAVVRQLIFARAALDDHDADGATPLHLAAAQGSVETLQFLLIAGASADHRDSTGLMPVHIAASTGNIGALGLSILNLTEAVALDKAEKDINYLLKHAPVFYGILCFCSFLWCSPNDHEKMHVLLIYVCVCARRAEILTDGFRSFGAPRWFRRELNAALGCSRGASGLRKILGWSDGPVVRAQRQRQLTTSRGNCICTSWRSTLFTSSLRPGECSESTWWDTFEFGTARWFSWSCANLACLGFEASVLWHAIISACGA